MDYNKLSEFFDLFVKDYAPFKDDYFYFQLVSYIKDNLLNDSYNNIPIELKKMYVDQEIPESTYDYFLISKGYTEDIVDKLDTNEKKILINTLIDFNRYKGTIEVFKKLINGFNKEINVYEMYLNYGYIGNSNTKEWYFFNKPVIIKNNNYTINKYPYDQIYKSVPNFFVQKENLNYDLKNGKLKIPFKTNLISLDMFQKVNINKKNIILSYLFLYKFQDEIMTIHFNDDLKYNIKIIDFMRLWNYCIILKHSPYNYKNFNINRSLIYSTEYSNFNLFLKNIGSDINNNFDNIFESVTNYFDNINDYASNANLKEMDNFFSPNIKRDVIFDNDLEKLTSFFEESLIDYIDLKYKKDFEGLINSLYDSFLNWAINNERSEISRYYYFFLNLIDNINVSKDKTLIHLINYLKPYHAELIQNFSKILGLQTPNYSYHTAKKKVIRCYVQNTKISHLIKFKKIGL